MTGGEDGDVLLPDTEAQGRRRREDDEDGVSRFEEGRAATRAPRRPLLDKMQRRGAIKDEDDRPREATSWVSP